MASITKVKGKTGITYNVRVRVVGQPTKSQNFKTRAEAKEWAVKTEATLTGRTFAVSRDATLSELIAEFSPRAKPSTRALLRYWDQALGRMRLRDITPPMIARHRDALLGAPTRSFGQKTSKPRSGSTVNHYLCALSIAFKFGVRDLGWCDANPAAQVRKLPGSRWRTRFLSDEERARLLAEARLHAHLYAAIVLSLSTGLRRGELHRLTWDDIDREARWAVLPKTKNGDMRGIPITKAALAALDALPRDSHVLFPFDLTKAWRAALRRAGIRDFRWHDLRHSAASHLVANGANAVEIATLLGHRTLGMVRRYAHLANNHTRSLIDRVMDAVH